MSLTVVTGPMFSGKSSSLHTRVRRARVAGLRVGCYVPVRDTRTPGRLVTHAGLAFEAYVVLGAPEIRDHVGIYTPDLVVVDEVQFFGFDLVPLLHRLAEDREVVAAGLNRDYRGGPYGVVARLLSLADCVETCHAVCAACKRDASFTHRLNDDRADVLVGGAEVYEARCRRCFYTVCREPWRP